MRMDGFDIIFILLRGAKKIRAISMQIVWVIGRRLTRFVPKGAV